MPDHHSCSPAVDAELDIRTDLIHYLGCQTTIVGNHSLNYTSPTGRRPLHSLPEDRSRLLDHSHSFALVADLHWDHDRPLAVTRQAIARLPIRLRASSFGASYRRRPTLFVRAFQRFCDPQYRLRTAFGRFGSIFCGTCGSSS